MGHKVFDELRECLCFAGDPPADVDQLESWAEEFLREDSLVEWDKKRPVPSDQNNKCDMFSYKQNVRYFFHKKSMAVRQAVAASLKILKKACGNDPQNLKRMSPKDIIGG